jgi:hypothetical protein
VPVVVAVTGLVFGDWLHNWAPARSGDAGAARERVELMHRGRYVVQVVPLIVKAVGVASLVLQVPWKPSDVEPPFAEMVEL